MKNNIDLFVKENNIKVSKTKNILKLKDLRFHLFKTWNELELTKDYVVFKQMQGKEYNYEYKEISRIKINEIGDYFYIPYKDIFIMFKIYKGGLKAIYKSNIVDRLSVNKETIIYFNFYKSIGIDCFFRFINFNMNSTDPYKLVPYES